MNTQKQATADVYTRIRGYVDHALGVEDDVDPHVHIPKHEADALLRRYARMEGDLREYRKPAESGMTITVRFTNADKQALDDMRELLVDAQRDVIRINRLVGSGDVEAGLLLKDVNRSIGSMLRLYRKLSDGVFGEVKRRLDKLTEGVAHG